MITPMVLRLLGIAGVPPGDNERTYRWERRLHGVMIGIVLASVLSLFLAEASGDRRLAFIGEALEWVIFLGFGAELAWMMSLSNQKLRYLQYNWLDLMIVVCSGLALAGAGTQWVALARLLRLTTVGLVLARAAKPLRKLFSPGGMPYVFGLAVLAFMIAGAGFYWLEPTVNSYGAGLWLAFVTGATVGYGDMVPTSPGARLFAVLIVLVGLTMFSLVTASIAAFFIGEEEKIRGREMHRDIQQVRQDMAKLIGDQEAQLRREMHDDIRRLREEVVRLREELGKSREE